MNLPTLLLLSSVFTCSSAFGAAPLCPKKVQGNPCPCPKEIQKKTSLCPQKVQENTAPVSLQETLELTYMQNAELDEARAGLRAKDEDLSVANADWRPSLSVIGNQTNDNHEPIGAGIKYHEFRTDYTASIEQNVFKGGGTVANIEKTESEVFSQRAGLFVKEQDILLDALKAHTAIIANQAIVHNQEERKAFAQKRLENAQVRYNVGEGSRADVAFAQAEFEQASAAVVKALGDLEISKANYLYQVGSAPGKLRPATIIVGVPNCYEEVLSVAKVRHPAITQAKYALEAANYNVDLQIAPLLPTVDVQGRYGADRRGGTNYPPPWNDRAQQNASVLTTVKVPIYQQGIPNAKIRQAYQTVGQQKVVLVKVTRQVGQAARTAWEQLIVARDNVKHFLAQVAALEVAVEGAVEEYNVGIKNIVDVFVERDKLANAQDNLANAQKALVDANYGVLQAMGRLTACDLKLNVKYYDPDAYYTKYKEEWIQFWQGEDLRYVKEKVK